MSVPHGIPLKPSVVANAPRASLRLVHSTRRSAKVFVVMMVAWVDLNF